MSKKPNNKHIAYALLVLGDITRTLFEMEKKIEENHGPMPGGVDAHTMVHMAIAMLFVGMLADPTDSGVLVRAAGMSMPDPLPGREHIRRNLDRLVDELGIKPTEHLWN